jgi:hypothetical protein
MSFRLRIQHIEVLDGETLIRGRLIEGSYFGPQYIRVKDAMGNGWTSTILTHGLIEPQGWPVTADHNTQLELHIATPPPPFVIDRSSAVEGLGSVAIRTNSIDLSKELSNPLFWGNFCDLCMYTDAMEQPGVELLGLSQEEMNSYYTDVLSPLIDSPTWPIFPLKIDSDRYVEIEWAGGAEFQERIWVGAKNSGDRVLLGYNSGHFSLPALRPSELVWLLDQLEQSDAHPAAGLMLMPMCYLPEADAVLTERAARVCGHIPGASSMHVSTMAANLVKNRIVPDTTWERRAPYGWCSNWPYSQRNPQGAMSVLSEADFGFIEQFFRA